MSFTYDILPLTNEVWGKVRFSRLSFCPHGGSASRRGSTFREAGGGQGSLHPGGRSASRRGRLHTGGRVCIQGEGVGQTPLDTTGYGQRAGGTHPTGMHSCLNFYFTEFYIAEIVQNIAGILFSHVIKKNQNRKWDCFGIVLYIHVYLSRN